MIALGAAVGLGMLWMMIRSRRRRSRTEQARELADRAASASLAQAQEWYEHRDEITENLVRVAEDLAHRAREQADQARDVYDHRDELIRDLSSFARDAREELMRRSGRS